MGVGSHRNAHAHSKGTHICATWKTWTHIPYRHTSGHMLTYEHMDACSMDIHEYPRILMLTVEHMNAHATCAHVPASHSCPQQET